MMAETSSGAGTPGSWLESRFAGAPKGAPAHARADDVLGALPTLGRQGIALAAALAAPDPRVRVDAFVRARRRSRAQDNSPWLLAAMLAYRELGAWRAMIGLYRRLPRRLRSLAGAREQAALAVNRVAETASRPSQRRAHRGRALALLAAVRGPERSAETWAILARVWRSAWEDGEPRALAQAIRAGEEGARLDPEDFYPAIGVALLRATRDRPEDRRRLPALLDQVEAILARAPAPNQPHEGFFRAVTGAHVAVLRGDAPGLEVALAAVPSGFGPWRASATRSWGLLPRRYALAAIAANRLAEG